LTVKTIGVIFYEMIQVFRAGRNSPPAVKPASQFGRFG